MNGVSLRSVLNPMMFHNFIPDLNASIECFLKSDWRSKACFMLLHLGPRIKATE